MKSNGFTLVELAVALMIIGLLIGGILKGKELILNSQITATGAQTQSIRMAVDGFKNTYRAIPGDMLSPGTRLPKCTASPCSDAGNGNRILGIDQGPTQENSSFWYHLKAVDMLPRVDVSQAPFKTISRPIGGSAWIVYISAVHWGGGITRQRTSHYLHTYNGGLLCHALMLYDKKFDDGKPNTGSIIMHPGNSRASDGVSYDPNLAGECLMIDAVKF